MDSLKPDGLFFGLKPDGLFLGLGGRHGQGSCRGGRASTG